MIDFDALFHRPSYKVLYLSQCVTSAGLRSALVEKDSQLRALHEESYRLSEDVRKAKQMVEELQQAIAQQEATIDLLKSEMSTKKTRTRKKSSEEAGSEAEN